VAIRSLKLRGVGYEEQQPTFMWKITVQA